MQIVINIPEWKYKNICEGVAAAKKFDYSISAVFEAVANGTVLPKGHGRIADIDKVLEEMKATKTYDIPFALGRVKPIIPAEAESGGEE